MKNKIDINDLRVDKCGDPEIYRRALSMYVDNDSSSSPRHAHQSSSSSVSSSQASPQDFIDEALSHDTRRRVALSRIEALRSKLSDLQKTVISPKMKAKEEVDNEVLERAKRWKLDIATLMTEMNDAGKGRDDVLEKINLILAKIVDDDSSNVISPAATNITSAKTLSLKEEEKMGNGEISSDGAEISPGSTQQQQPTKILHPKLSISAPEFSPKTISSHTTMKPPPMNGSSISVASSSSSSSSSSSTTTNLSILLSPEQIKSIPPERILNLNVGVLGHVDTGKTSLVKILSSVLSTAALDKSKQSRSRGITLDLGFSAFLLPLPEHLKDAAIACASVDDVADDCDGSGGSGKTNTTTTVLGDGTATATTNNSKHNGNTNNGNDANTDATSLQNRYDLLQVTLVDCPGHASLIRTIIGGAQIIDMILLVVDATKGMQTQTAECLVIAEMTTRNLIVVLNKIDMFPESEREERVRIAEKKMRAALRGTKFENAHMIGISACVGGEKVAAVVGSAGGIGGESVHHHHQQQHGCVVVDNVTATHNIHGLVSLLQSQMRAPNRDARPSPEQFHFAVDHCFPMKGQGTVLTGTCLSGSARPNDMVEFPTLATRKKIKGLQMFRRKANIIQQGDRAGICVSNFDAKLMERGIIAAPGTVKLIRGAIAVVRKVRFFKGRLNSGAKFHISVGHTTVMATVTFWGAREIAQQQEEEQMKEDHTKLEESNANKLSRAAFGKSSLGGSADLAGLPLLKFDWNQDFLHQDNYLDVLPTTESTNTSDASLQHGNSKADTLPPLHWARLEFLTPVYCPMDSLVIGSRLDSEVNASACRLAFSGRLVERCDDIKDNGRLKTYTKKEKIGIVDRLGDPYKRTDDGKIVRYEVYGSDLFKKETNMTQFVGLLVHTDNGDIGSIQSSFGTSGQFRVRFPGGTDVCEGDALYLRFKRYANDPKKAIHQDGTLPPARAGLPIESPVKIKKKKKNSKGKNGNSQAMTENATKPMNRSIGDIESIKGEVLIHNGKHTVAIVSGLFSMEDNINQHKGRNVLAMSTNEEGQLVGSFGKMGKCKVLFKDGISAEIGSKVKII